MSKTINCGSTDPSGKLVCAHNVTADTPEDAMAQLGTHAKEAHADMMASATPEQMENWGKNFKENVWPNAADNAPAEPETPAETA